MRIYAATPEPPPAEILPAPSPRKYWARRGLAEWFAAELLSGPPDLVGIDHAFSFPMRSFETHRLPQEWRAFLDDFQRHWPTGEGGMYVDFIRDGLYGDGADGQFSLASARGGTVPCKVGLPLRRARQRRQVHARRPAVAAFPSQPVWLETSLLAVRWLEAAARALGHRGGLSRSIESLLSKR